MERRNPPLKKTKGEIDGDLQSRQLATYGMSVMERLAGASVLIIGMNGLGVEVAKNIVLANVNKVTLADDRVASLRDMGSHFYLQPDDVGHTNRAEACFRSIKDVNPGVDVTCWMAPISEELLADHDAVCVCDGVCRGEDQAASFNWNEFCRCRGVSFIRCEARGVFGYVFDDLTSSVAGAGTFCVPDPGHTIAHISNSKAAVVTIDQPNVWGSLVGKTVKFSGIHGMRELNGVCAVVAAQEYRVLFGHEKQLLVTLKDIDTSGMAAYRNGGVMTIDPFETVHQFTSFRDAWLSGATAENDSSAWPLIGDHGQNDHPFGVKCEISGLPNKHITRMLRAAFRALENDPGRTFNPGDEAEALAFVDEICGVIKLFDPRDFFFDDEFDCKKSIDNREAVIDGMRPFFITFAMSCAGSINAVCACVGGIAAQEIIKSVALIEDPLSQFLFVSFADILPKPLPSFQEVLPLNSRYDSHIAVLGAPFHSELRKLKVLIVGAGATGSELLKNFAMCGIGTAAPNNVMVADHDVVERSNLSRQFLYRSCDIKQKKAERAASAAAVMNSDFKVLGKPNRIDEETPATFGYQCDVTIMALDSDKARKFVSQRCKDSFGRPQPCLNLGTTGLSLSTDAIIPHVTVSYQNMEGHSTEPEEVPCQEKTVPKTIRHCISLAKTQFELLFVGKKKDAEPLSLMQMRSWDDCIVWARKLFDWCNSSWVEDIKRQYDSRDAIWQGRALPDVVQFDPSDELVRQFVGSAAILKATASGIQLPETCDENSKRFAAIAQAAASLNSARLPEDLDHAPSRITHFEKDDDANFHVDFIAACANLKARMFHITPAISNFRAKIEAGGIIPAVATSTSVASAFTCIDVFRVALHKRSPGCVSFPGRQMNLQFPKHSFLTTQPLPPKSAKITSTSGEYQWTEWSPRFDASSSMTLMQLVDSLRRDHHLPVKVLQYEGYNNPPLYDEVQARDEQKMNMKLIDLVTYKKKGEGLEESPKSILEEYFSICITIFPDSEEQQPIALPSLRILLDDV